MNRVLTLLSSIAFTLLMLMGGLAEAVEQQKNLGLKEAEASIANLPPMVAQITDDLKLTVFEGLPHQTYNREQLAEELKSKDTVFRHSFPFYQAPILPAAEDVRQLNALIKATKSFEAWTPKKCGAFHPDYSLVWNNNGQTIEIQVCLGCDDIRAYHGGVVVWASISTPALGPLLRKYQKQCPKPRNYPGP